MFYQFKLRFSFIIFLLFNLTTVAFSDVNKIDQIDIQGTQRIDVETVISYSNVDLGDIYTEELGNKILKDLFDTNLFSNIEVIFDENRLQINVKENPTINLVSFLEIVKSKMKIYSLKYHSKNDLFIQGVK